MKTLLFSVVVLAGLSSALAGETSVRIVGKERDTELIHVDNIWRKDLPQRLKVALRAAQETPAREVVFKAYFFDANGRLLHQQNKPNKIWGNTGKGIGEIEMPDPVPSTKAAHVYLALPEKLKDLKTTIVVFGKPGELAADLYPSGKKLEDFDFPEKAEVTKK